MSEQTKLKPCPYCGSEDLAEDTGGNSVFIRCKKCGAFGPNHTDNRHWNTRAPEATA